VRHDAAVDLTTRSGQSGTIDVAFPLRC
jgi:hypothetical protein